MRHATDAVAVQLYPPPAPPQSQFSGEKHAMRYMTACLLILTVVLVASCAGSPDPAPEVAKAPLPIRVVPFPEQSLLIRAHTGPFAEISTSIDEFLNYLGTTGIEPTGDL